MHYIRLVYFTMAMLVTTTLSAELHEDHPYEFEVYKDTYMMSTHFMIESKNTYMGRVKKSSVRVLTCYDLSDKHGWQATGVMNPLSPLGWVYAWGSEIYIHDTREVTIGMIDGQAVTGSAAQFSIYKYDDAGNYTKIGIAYLDKELDSFSVLYPDGSPIPIAKLQRMVVPGGEDYWRVRVYHPESIDDRVIRIFAAFVVDHQNAFKPNVDKLLAEYEGEEE